MARVELSKIINALRQPSGVHERRLGIALFSKALRRGDRFSEVWVGAGGATGLANLMAEFSVHEARLICTKLGRTAAAINARTERRAALGELVRLLHHHDPIDRRPLHAHYQHIVPACAPELVKEWEDRRRVEWTKNQEKRLFYGHRDLNEESFLAEAFSTDKDNSLFASQKKLFQWNLAFSERIFNHLLTLEGEVKIPNDFMKEFAMPLLQRLRRRCYNDETRVKFLSLTMQCLQKYPDALGPQLNISEGGLIHYAIRRWVELPENDKDHAKQYLIQLLELLPIRYQEPLRSIHESIGLHEKLEPAARYELLRLFLRHMRAYEIDIEDDSQEGLDRLKEMPVKSPSLDMWIGRMFLDFDNKNARQLFERLAKAHPSGDFLYIGDNWQNTILKQSQSPNLSYRGDAEIVRYLLMSKSDDANKNDSDWLSRVRMLVNERRQKSQESRESDDRAFWAKSALYLCVAAGDLKSFSETVLWARRFNMDGMTASLLYEGDVFEAKELMEVLSAIPNKNHVKPDTIAVASVKDNIQLSNKAFMDLHETALLISQGQSGGRICWSGILKLSKAIVDRRCENALVLRGTEAEIIEVVWKPTLEVLVKVEALLSKPSLESLSYQHLSVAASGVHVLQQIPKATPSLLAELARFLLDMMNATLGPEKMRWKTRAVVEVVMRVAESDEPAKACPFICDMILHSDHNSSWHRHLINTGFLNSLPARLAREFVCTMADAIRNNMKDQNAPLTDAKGHSTPAVKVTTIKMMATLLQNNSFLDPGSSCNVLIGLLAEARHIDARITIVNSLISIIQKPTCSPELRTLIIDAIGEYIVPVASQLNERRSLSEADWDDAAEPAAKLPEVGSQHILLSMLLECVNGPELTSNERKRLAGFAIQALEQSAVSNSRWMKLFLEKNNLDMDEHLPSVPVSLGRHSLIELEHFRTYMPASFLALLRELVLGNINPSPGISRITKMVKTNNKLVNTNAGKHWLDQFDNPGIKSFALGLSWVISWLQSPVGKAKSELQAMEGVTIAMLQDFVAAVAERLLIGGDTQAMESLINKLCTHRFCNLESWKAWKSHCVPLVNRIIDQIEKTRMGEGSIAERGQIPSILPNTMRLRTSMLPTPYSTQKEPPLPNDVVSFISTLSDFVDLLAERSLPYHDDFSALKTRLVETLRAKELASYALKMMAKVSSEKLLLADYLRAELVGVFLLEATDPNDEAVVSGARRVVCDWKSSQVEGFRTLGSSIEARLRVRGKAHWFNKT